MLRLSLTQLVRFVVGIGFALVVIVIGYCYIALNLVPLRPGHLRWETALGTTFRLILLGIVVALYYWGGITAYRVASNLGESPEASLAKSVYSWFQVAGTFGDWMIDHKNDPLGQTVDHFKTLM